jgi:hypothetical protein
MQDRSEPNFRKILELKGITRKQEQAHLVELFNAHKASPANEILQLSNPLIANISLQAAGATAPGIAALKDSAASHSAPALAGTTARFDPSTFGSALMNAARDGVDRFGSPALGGTASATNASRATSPPPIGGLNAESAHASINENLKNIGKFFRRDVSGFGGFGKKEEGRRSMEKR